MSFARALIGEMQYTWSLSEPSSAFTKSSMTARKAVSVS